jgi:hypothetical protein
MGRFKVSIIAATAAVLLGAAYTAAQGTLPDRATMVTISAPVSVPGTVLPAGEYLFRLADSQASRNVVQIFNKDRSKIFATLIAVSAQRDEPSGEAVITFRETPADQPPALRYWYYAGEKAGQEFAYPKDQAVKIARASGESVMAVDGSDMDSMQKGEMHRIDANSPEVASAPPASPAESQPAAPAPAEPQAAAPVAPAEPAPAPAAPQSAAPAPAEPAPTPTPAPAEPAPAVTPAEPPAAPVERPSEPQAAATAGRDVVPAPAGTSGRADAAAAPATDSELPRTASELPLIVLMGFLALGAAIGFRALRLSL